MLIMNYQNLKNRQTTNLAVFERFWVVFGLFLWVYCNFSHFGKFSSPKTNYFANNELSKPENCRPANLVVLGCFCGYLTSNRAVFGRFLGGFWAVFVAIFIICKIIRIGE